MKGSENKEMEYEALKEFIGLLYIEGNLSNRVRIAINEELTDRQRELINLYYIEQMSMTEIAQNLGLSPSTVSRTLKRGRGRLKRYLKYNGRYFAEAVSE
ncbi:MAG: sigma-70 family RNA polymerase sigma factor [Oscillospiraceae bacterium]|nr:sigma-70 family RNA polymerase sigma factor [Oscillospiraceae bacterium]